MALKYGQVGICEPSDIAQDTMIKVLRKNNDRPITNSWLYTVVRSAAADASRRAKSSLRPIWIDRNDERTPAICECADEHGHERHLHAEKMHCGNRRSAEGSDDVVRVDYTA